MTADSLGTFDGVLATLLEEGSELSAALREDKVALVYNLDLLRATLRRVQSLFPAHFTHCVATKSCPLRSILTLASEERFGAEVASHTELLQALRLGIDATSIVFDSPCKTEKEIEFALSNHVTINIDNFQELQRVVSNAHALATSTSRIGIRVNPQIRSGDIAATSTATKTSKFGVGLADHMDELINSFNKYPFLTGIHAHMGSQGCNISLIVEGIRVVVDFALRVNKERREIGLSPLQWIDIGGGLPIDYASNAPPTFEEYAKMLRENVPELFDDTFSTVCTEFGRSLFAKCGWVCSEVEYTKTTGGRQIAVAHCGADLFVRAAYVPQVWAHRVSVCSPHGTFKSEPQDQWAEQDVVGPLCFSGDVIAHSRNLPLIEQGDWVVIHDAGAYTIGMWSRYNSRRAPAVIGYERVAGTLVFSLLKKREAAEEVLQFWE